MKLRRALTAALREVGMKKAYKSGFQAGYDLGFQIGKEDSCRPFDGVSIIIPTRLHGENVMRIIQKIEALTPHPYELIVANAGSSEVTMQYLQKRTGSVRHISSRNGEGIVGILNKAFFAAHGQILVVLIAVSPNINDWMDDLIMEPKRDSLKITVVTSASSSHSPELKATSILGNVDVHSRMNVCCLVFSKALLSDIGWWNEGFATLNESMSEWLSRIPNQNKIMVEAFNRFI
ncbi:glycosyltransferase family 2 protein [Paenibacillus faecalis]|uniref:glycosyltransferase family 2 protein n=1 Tax=Paenibacillus faecalis TaxID=2079532 RepID=UPI000D0EB31C|nr:glycosyltransferase family A protein [Paenibacillus faecalis]